MRLVLSTLSSISKDFFNKRGNINLNTNIWPHKRQGCNEKGNAKIAIAT